MVFNSDLARKKFFASKVNRKQYDKYFYAKGEQYNQYSGKDMVGMKKRGSGDLFVPHQRTGELTEGTVAKLLTNSTNHPHGIKVQLASGLVGRVKNIIE